MRTITSGDDFASVLREIPLVVAKFEADWCGPCKAIKPTIAQLETAHRDVLFVRVDIDEHDDLSALHSIATVPTFLFFVRGQLVDTLKGANAQHLRHKVAGLPAELAKSAALAPVPVQQQQHAFFDAVFPSADADWNLGAQYDHTLLTYVVAGHADTRNVDALVVTSPGRTGSLCVGDIIIRYARSRCRVALFLLVLTCVHRLFHVLQRQRHTAAEQRSPPHYHRQQPGLQVRGLETDRRSGPAADVAVAPAGGWGRPRLISCRRRVGVRRGLCRQTCGNAWSPGGGADGARRSSGGCRRVPGRPALRYVTLYLLTASCFSRRSSEPHRVVCGFTTQRWSTRHTRRTGWSSSNETLRACAPRPPPRRPRRQATPSAGP